MAIVYQHNKKTGLTYAYESKSYYDKEKKMSRSKRKLIGRVDSETGEIVPTDGRNRKPKSEKSKDPDYKKLYEGLQRKFEAQSVLIESLKKENQKLKEE